MGHETSAPVDTHNPYPFGIKECHLVSDGICPLDSLSIGELLESNFVQSTPYDSDQSYCPLLAKALLIDDPRDIHLHYKNPGVDGRHRECIAKKLGIHLSLRVGSPTAEELKLRDRTYTIS